jgi:hypothetical protein
MLSDVLKGMKVKLMPSTAELLATSPSTQACSQNKLHPAVRPSDGPTPTVGLIVKAAESNTSSHEAKRLIKEAVDPKALKLG